MAYTVGQVARAARVNIQTVRFYERKNLIAPDLRKDSGYRIFGLETVLKIRFIKRAQALGFTLNEISGLLRLSVVKGSQCASMKIRAQQKLKDVENKITHLKALERELQKLIYSCNKKKTTDPCPILRALEKSGCEIQ